MKIETFSDIKITKDTKGNTMYTTVVFTDGSKERLRKRVKEVDIINIKRSWEEMLKMGMNPLLLESEMALLKISGKLNVNDVLEDFFLSRRVTPKTLEGYKSKLSEFSEKYGSYLLENITNKQIEDLLKNKVDDDSYAQSTFAHAKKIYSTFFNFCVENSFLKTSPLNISKTIKSKKDTGDRHVPFSENHFQLIIDELKKDTNKMVFNFINFLYTIHLRPNEIRNLKKQDIDLEKNVITIKASIAKNSKKEILPIFTSLRKIIDGMNLDALEDDDYIFFQPFKNGKKTKIGESFMSDYFRNKILKPLNLHLKTGYTLYSFKAKGNLDKLDKHAWTLPQLQKCNRHSTIAQTLTYLKNIGKITEIDDLSITDL